MAEGVGEGWRVERTVWYHIAERACNGDTNPVSAFPDVTGQKRGVSVFPIFTATSCFVEREWYLAANATSKTYDRHLKQAQTDNSRSHCFAFICR